MVGHGPNGVSEHPGPHVTEVESPQTAFAHSASAFFRHLQILNDRGRHTTRVQRTKQQIGTGFLPNDPYNGDPLTADQMAAVDNYRGEMHHIWTYDPEEAAIEDDATVLSDVTLAPNEVRHAMNPPPRAVRANLVCPQAPRISTVHLRASPRLASPRLLSPRLVSPRLWRERQNLHPAYAYAPLGVRRVTYPVPCPASPNPAMSSLASPRRTPTPGFQKCERARPSTTSAHGFFCDDRDGLSPSAAEARLQRCSPASHSRRFVSPRTFCTTPEEGELVNLASPRSFAQCNATQVAVERMGRGHGTPPHERRVGISPLDLRQDSRGPCESPIAPCALGTWDAKVASPRAFYRRPVIPKLTMPRTSETHTTQTSQQAQNGYPHAAPSIRLATPRPASPFPDVGQIGALASPRCTPRDSTAFRNLCATPVALASRITPRRMLRGAPGFPVLASPRGFVGRNDTNPHVREGNAPVDAARVRCEPMVHDTRCMWPRSNAEQSVAKKWMTAWQDIALPCVAESAPYTQVSAGSKATCRAPLPQTRSSLDSCGMRQKQGEFRPRQRCAVTPFARYHLTPQRAVWAHPTPRTQSPPWRFRSPQMIQQTAPPPRRYALAQAGHFAS